MSGAAGGVGYLTLEAARSYSQPPTLSCAGRYWEREIKGEAAGAASLAAHAGKEVRDGEVADGTGGGDGRLRDMAAEG